MIPALILFAVYSLTLKMEAICSSETSVAFHSGFLLGSFFNPGDGSDIFALNID
jgi:hypothetical protein